MPTNPRSFQTMYLRLGLGMDSYVGRPLALQGPWAQAQDTAVLSFARYMGPLPGGPGQIGSTRVFAAIPDATTQYLALGQFVSDPLEQQAIPAGGWRVAFALRLANAAVGFTWRGRCALYVLDGARGTRRATVFSVNAIGSGLTNTNTELTVLYDNTSGLACNALPGDVLALELGMEIENTSGGAVVPLASLFADGEDPILVLFGAATSPQSLLQAPVPLVRTLPTPHEQPDASVTEPQARELCLQAWPPGTFHEFGEPAPGQRRAPDAELMDWFALLWKRFFWDLVDILRREMDPGRAVLKLSDWRDLYQIVSNPSRREDLAALVLARLREFGQGCTLYGVAASLGTILGYADPTQIEILQLSPSQLRAAVQYVFPLPGPVAIPAAASFAGALQLLTPHLYDGGAVWSSGTWLSLVFSVAAGKRIHVRLTAPDGQSKTWSPITQTHEVTTAVLYGVELAGRPVHGNWLLEVYREMGAPALDLIGSVLYAPGAPRTQGVGPSVPPALGPPWPDVVPNVVSRAGLGRWIEWFGVYADPAKMGVKSAADLREARAALSRIRLALNRADLVLTKSPIPGDSKTIPGAAIPG